MHMLFDGVPVGSAGNLHLQRELARSVLRRRPAHSRVTLLLPFASEIGECDCVVKRFDRPSSLIDRARWFHQTLPALAAELEADAVYSLGGIVSGRLQRHCAVVTTVNDLWPFAYREASDHTLSIRSTTRLRILRWAYNRSLEKADYVVLHSQYAKDVLAKEVPSIAAKSLIAWSGIPNDLTAGSSEDLPHPNNGRPYLLYLSPLYPYKNHIRLADAYDMACQSLGSVVPELILAGVSPDVKYGDAVQARVRKARIPGSIRYVGRLERDSIPAWLHHATANIFPSKCEANSTIIAEVLSVGGVLACSADSSMSEVCQNAAATFEMNDVGSIAQTIAELCTNDNLRAALRVRARARAEKLSWEECGSAIWIAADRAIAARMERGKQG